MVRESFVRASSALSRGWQRLGAAASHAVIRSRLALSGGSLAREDGQTTAEYALVILASAAVALVLLAWAKSTGKLPDFFDKVIDNITGSFS